MPPVAIRPALYDAPAVPTGNDDVEIASVGVAGSDGLLLPFEVTIKFAVFDSAPVCVFCTFNRTTAGEAMLLLCTVVVKVSESTTDVGSDLPFQRITACFEKFAPTTFIVRPLLPAATV